MNNKLVYGFIAALAAGALALAYLVWLRAPAMPRGSAPPSDLPVQPAAPAKPEPSIRHPVAPAPVPLPALDASDAYVKSALDELLGARAVLSFLRTESFVRRAVVTVDNLGRPHAPPRMWPVDPTRGRFTVDQVSDRALIGADNARRYAPFVSLIESVDSARAAALYFRLYPLFQSAYEEIGHPGRYFNDRLIAVIDLLLATPEPAGALRVELTEVPGPLKPVRPWVNYRFADPAYEALASGQKMLLRAGPDHRRRLKAKLAELRRHLAGGAVSPPANRAGG